MTAHKPKPTITPERIAWFSAYHAVNLAWGAFHVALDDGNYDCGAGPHHPTQTDEIRATWPEDLREACEWFDKLTPSQRRRLSKRVSEYEARYVVLLDADGKEIGRARLNHYGEAQFDAARPATAVTWVIVDGLRHEIRRGAVRP